MRKLNLSKSNLGELLATLTSFALVGTFAWALICKKPEYYDPTKANTTEVVDYALLTDINGYTSHWDGEIDMNYYDYFATEKGKRFRLHNNELGSRCLEVRVKYDSKGQGEIDFQEAPSEKCQGIERVKQCHEGELLGFIPRTVCNDVSDSYPKPSP